CGMNGAAFALAISDIPWNGPIAGIAVGLIDGEPVLMPNEAQCAASAMALTVAGDEQKVCMIECAANQVPEDQMLRAIIAGHKEAAKLVRFISEVRDEIGAPKIVFTSIEVDHDLFEAVKEFAIDRVRVALDTDDKNVREERLKPIEADIHEKFEAECPELAYQLDEAIYKLQKYVVRRWLLDDGKRVDGRKLDEIRPLSAEVGLIPRVHGSALFTRGQTQALTITTLGAISEAQILDGIDSDERKRYMHQYNFPPYSVGETRPSRGPGRREIGHGALAEKALLPVIPSPEDFPYAFRVVSEITSSNGSTSQASICASTLSLMDAGVPLKAPVAGISCGLITEGDRWMTMVDIQGLEDFFGDMDFKVGGTHAGITAIQVDIKIDGLTYEIIEEALRKTREARCYILDEVMLKALPAPRAQLSTYAPKMLTLKIHPDKIREVIGSGGKVIQKISAECNCKID
ncbi:MAG: polyribonucleotide nucleotidyltransferase, partial [Oscillospiraceae bacterium]